MDIPTLLKNLREEVSCPVCRDIFSDPRYLSCQHSFCLGCLQDWHRASGNGNTIRCPKCQTLSRLPASGHVNDIPTSFYLNSLIDVLAIKDCNTTQVTCRNCDKKSSEAWYCFQCCKFYCEQCLIGHNITKGNKNHSILAVKEFQDKDYEDLLKRPAFCSKKRHEKEELRFFCKSCKTAACPICFALEHSGHAFVLIKDEAEQQRTEIRKTVETQRQNLQAKRNTIKQLNDNKTKLRQQGEDVKRHVQTFIDSLIEVLVKKKQNIIKAVESQTKQSVVYLSTETVKIESEIKEIETSLEKAETLLTRTTDIEVVNVGMKASFQIFLEGSVQNKTVSRVPGRLPSFTFVKNGILIEAIEREELGSLNISHPTNASQSFAEGKGLKEALAGIESKFNLITRDYEKSMRYNKKDLVTVEILDEQKRDCEMGVRIQDNKTGRYQISYCPRDQGKYSISIKVNGQHVCGSPYGLLVKARKDVVGSGDLSAWGKNSAGRQSSPSASRYVPSVPGEFISITRNLEGATPAENTESSTLTGRNILSCTVTKAGVVASNDSIELFCPPGAVDNPVSVKVTLDDQFKYFGLITQKDLENDVMFATPIFRFQPNSQAFKKPVTLTTKINLTKCRCDDIVILLGTEAEDGSITWEDITHNSTLKMLDETTAELKIKMEHFSLLMNLWNLASIRVWDLVSRLNLMAFSYTMSVFLNQDSPFTISDELALLLVSKDVYYQQVYQESETSALAQLRRQGFKELHLQPMEEQEEKRIYHKETLGISVCVGEDYKLLHSQGTTSFTVHSHILWNIGEVIKFKLERAKDVRVLCGTISVQGEYGHASKWHFCERDLCGFVRGLLGVKGAPFNLVPVARKLETPDVLMNEILKSWKDEDKQLKKILKQWSENKTDVAKELARIRKDLEDLRQACRLTERGQMHVRHLRELASKISGLHSSNADLIKYFSCCIQNVCKAILRDCCIELQDSAEGVETAASTADHVRYLQHYRSIPSDIAGKYQMVCSPSAESPLNTFLLIAPNLIQDIKEIFFVRGISEVQNGLKGLPKEACEQFASTVLFAESNKSIRPLACEVCNILEKLCLKNCGRQSTSEIETWGTNLAILSMLNFLKPYFQDRPQDIRLHKRLQLFSGCLREIMSDEILVASDFFLLDSSNVTLSLIQFAKFNPSKLVRFELTDSSNSAVSCLREDVKYDSCHDTFSQQFHVKMESEDELHLCALACVHLDGQICKKGAFESVITLKPSGKDAFDRLMIRFVDVAVIKLKVKDSEDLRVVLCSVQKDTLSDLLHVVKKDLTEELVDLRRSAVSKCHLKMRTVDAKAGMVLSLRLVYKWGSESVALDSKHFETLADTSAGGAYLPEMQIVGLKDPLTSEDAPLSLASPAGNLTLSSFDQLQKHGQIRCDKFEYHVHQTVNNMTGHNCVAGNDATLNEVIPRPSALQIGSSFSPRRSLTKQKKYEELPPSDHMS